MYTEEYIYSHDNQQLNGYLAYDAQAQGLQPAVLVVHDWSGRNDFACRQAEHLAKSGYIGFAVDMYGEGKTGESIEEKQALMGPFIKDKRLLRARIQAALQAVLTLKNVDPQRIAIMGFCFGGMCALELARSGADLVGVVTFHGILTPSKELTSYPIKAKILVLHGYEDPMVSHHDVEAFCQEMNAGNVDWQLNVYGNAQHAFTNPNAHDKQRGLVYNNQAAKRSFQALMNFLEEVFSLHSVKS